MTSASGAQSCSRPTTGTRPIMNLARALSFGITALGVLLIAAGILLNLSPIVTIAGMMLIVAGIVKIAMVAIWRTMFQFPDAGQPASTRVSSSRPGGTGKSNEVWHEKLP